MVAWLDSRAGPGCIGAVSARAGECTRCQPLPHRSLPLRTASDTARKPERNRLACGPTPSEDGTMRFPGMLLLLAGLYGVIIDDIPAAYRLRIPGLDARNHQAVGAALL